jgi:hypothetical protein
MITDDWQPRQKAALDRATAKIRKDSEPLPILVSKVAGVRYNPTRKIWEVKRKNGKKYVLQLTLPTRGQAEAIAKGFDLGVRAAMEILHRASQDDRRTTIYDKMDDLLPEIDERGED